MAHPAENSKWFDLVRRVKQGADVEVAGGGKEVHAADVAKGILCLLQADGDRVTGEVFNCYDRYISQHEVASIAKELAGTSSNIIGEPRTPKNQIETGKIRSLGLEFGGESRLRKTIQELLA